MTVKKNFVYFLLSKIVKGITPFIFLPYIIMHIGTDEYGKFSYYESIMLLVSQFVLWGGPQLISERYNQFNLTKTLFFISSSVLINSFLVSACLIFILKLNWIDGIIIGLGILFLSRFNIKLAVLRISNNAKSVLYLDSIGSLVRYIVPLILILLGYKDFKILVVGFILSNTIYEIVRYKVKENTKQYKIEYKDYFRFGGKVVLFSASSYLISFSDRLFVQNYLGDTSLGFYAIAYKISSVVQVVFLSLTSSLIPKIYSSDMTFYEFIKKITTPKNIIILVFGFITFLLCGYFYISFFYSSDFEVALIPFLIISIALVFHGLVSILYHYLCRDNLHNLVAVITLLSALINIVLNLSWIPKYGIIAAAYTTLISYVFSFILFLISNNLKNDRS